MTKKEILADLKGLNVKILSKDKVWWGRLHEKIWPGFWFTIGHTIIHPPKVKEYQDSKEMIALEDPLDPKWKNRFYTVIEHELVHVRQIIRHEWMFRWL